MRLKRLSVAQDAPGLQIGSATTVVVALVGMQFPWFLARSPRQTSQRRDGIKALLKQHRVMPVGPTDQHDQWNTVSIYNDVPFGAQFSSVGRVGAGLQAPRGLGTVEPSMLARSQSIWSCSRKRISMAWCSCSHNPAACQSRSRRQQVMPLPKPMD